MFDQLYLYLMKKTVLEDKNVIDHIYFQHRDGKYITKSTNSLKCIAMTILHLCNDFSVCSTFTVIEIYDRNFLFLFWCEIFSHKSVDLMTQRRTKALNEQLPKGPWWKLYARLKGLNRDSGLWSLSCLYFVAIFTLGDTVNMYYYIYINYRIHFIKLILPVHGAILILPYESFYSASFMIFVFDYFF